MSQVDSTPRPGDPCGLVLSGGGARGPYQAGILAGIVEVLGKRPEDRSPFQVFAGTSIGALNVAFAAAHAQRGDLAVDGLITTWATLTLQEAVKPRPFSLLRELIRPGREEARSLLEPDPLVDMVRDPKLWEQLHQNVANDIVSALFISTLDVGSGRTTLFAELSDACPYAPTRDPKRETVVGPLSIEHLMASTALPVILPPQRIGPSLFIDGGMRFNTPIAPAIRAGANRLCVVSLIHRDPNTRRESLVTEEQAKSVPFLVGKLLDAVLLDPVDYDLDIVRRINDLITVLEEALPQDQLEKVQQTVIQSRGAPWRRVDLLEFSPSANIGTIASEFVKERKDRWRKGDGLFHRLLYRAASSPEPIDSDWASFLLFDGEWADVLIELGRSDALSRADEIRAFFAG